MMNKIRSDEMTHITLNAAQIFRLWAAIRQTNPNSFNAINRSFNSCKSIYVEYDLQGGYFLTFGYNNYYNQHCVLWDLDDDIHNYIMNGDGAEV